MLFKPYLTPTHEHDIEHEVKRSKFLTFARPTATTATANDFVKALRAAHPQANHVCWAYIVGSPDSTLRSMSDDGEPSGTAGMPMLKILEHSGLGDITVAVVRYFGGTKLGTGGLQRAYSDAVAQVLKELQTEEKVDRVAVQASFDYALEGAIKSALGSFNCAKTDFNYAESVSLTSLVPRNELDAFCEELTNICSGKLTLLVSKDN
ncbi:YigZ family protein [Alteromonas sp. W364]|uniref:YigZ family protein n=1 Tax=Alteromonas sp. W364 TaxID=3075610 RepID=UPI002887293D|nr:YigZ family protein [Alteromonas sp. W364]MDT0627941.1 YigZ family protein [Alteromonas sp. W364]